MKKYNNFIVTGCSFSSGVINAHSTEHWKTAAFSWPHYCFLEMDPEHSQFLNFALPGGGNIAAMTNLVLYLEQHPDVTGSNTLVGLNITALERFDIICAPGAPGTVYNLAAQHVTQELDIGWIHNQHSRHLKHSTSAGVQKSCISLIQAMVYLESKSIDYFFMLMTQDIYTYSPDWFKRFLDARTHHWVKFDSTIGMLEYIKKHELITDDLHPTRAGHGVLAGHVIKHLTNNE